MSNALFPEYSVAHARPESFYESFDRKDELQHQTHFCPGCGHGIVHKMLAKAIDELGIQDKTILIGPVGCAVFTYYYFDVGGVQAAHGRAPAVATAMRRSRPEAIVLGYQGDGDLSAIGAAEILHAANRGENITIIFVNNAIYSMTGGQYAPTTLIGQKSQTSPLGRTVANEGYPMDVSKLLAALEGPIYIERVGLGDNKQINQAAKAIKRAVSNQVEGRGFSLVEVLSPCPTIWKQSPVQAQKWVKEVMEKTYPLGVYCDRTQDGRPRYQGPQKTPLAEIPHLLGVADADLPAGNPDELDRNAKVDLHVRVAGFGGQGVLLLGEMLAEAGLDAGLEVSWLPSYGPEIRSGTSNCHVRISRDPIDSPMVAEPNLLVAMNEPSLRKFIAHVRPGGTVFYNGDSIPEGCEREDLRMIVAPFIEAAHQLGDSRSGNMVLLGAVLEHTQSLPEASVEAALHRLVKHPRWLDLNTRAIAHGREMYLAAQQEVVSIA